MTTLVCDVEKELSNLYASYYFSENEEERAAIEAKILASLNERKDDL